MPVRTLRIILGGMILLIAAAGCLPTSETAGISALSRRYEPALTPDALQTGFPSSPITPPSPTSPSPVPEAAASPAVPADPLPQVCGEKKGTFRHGEIPSTFLKDPLKFRVYLPPCFSDTEDRSYPLLLLLHGSIFNDDQWDRLGMDETADRLITSGKIPPLVIVMPFEEQTLANPYQPGYGSALTRELLPWLEEEYPLCEDRSCRAVGGISRGAAWAVHVGFGDWQMFGSIGTHSLPPFWGDLNSLPLWLADIPDDKLPRVFMDVGRGDPYRQPAAQFEEFLTANNVPHEWYLFTGSHDETYWSAHVEQYLLWYSEAWQDR